jgi:type I restriction enzyme, S subunit
MNSPWPMVKLGEVLQRSEETIAILPEADYREVTVRLWGKGVVLRGIVAGVGIAASRRFVTKAGQLILSRIDARNGAIGVVPAELDGAVVTNDFPLFDLRPERVGAGFLGWLAKTRDFVELCQRASEGTTNRVRLQEDRFLALEIPLPPLAEQQRIVARIEELAAKIDEARGVQDQETLEIRQVLLGAFFRITERAPRKPLREVAPLVRRPVELNALSSYPELGIRSFGKGTFHKPALSGTEIGEKRVFRIEPGDLLFSNVFAWEGAIAVAKPVDAGRIGSHRFISCVPNPGVATAAFLCFYFLTDEGLEKIGAASPGGAGRNRTLGLATLESVEAPVPPMHDQRWFNAVQMKLDTLKQLQGETAAELDALLPSILDRAFAGAL